MPTLASPPFDGGITAGLWARGAGSSPRLLLELQRDLPTLSPKLRSVARFCIQHASTLHHHRIQDVALACGTIPASVVRLAQRFGLKGFQELKLAFLDGVEHGADDLSEPQLQPECSAALQDIEDSALGLASLKGLVLRPEFLHAVQSLRSARHIRFDWAGEVDRTIATHLQARMRAAGCHQVDTTMLEATSHTPPPGAWLVQIAVWDDMAPGVRAPDTHAPTATHFGPRVLKLVRGRMNRFATRTPEGVAVRVGTDARRMLNALALCEALATAVKPGSRRLKSDPFNP